MTTKSLTDVMAEVEKMDCVYSASIWNGRRVYVNLVGVNKAFAGDRNLKVYFDTKQGWIVDGIKGNRSNAVVSSLNAFAAAHNIRRTW